MRRAFLLDDLGDDLRRDRSWSRSQIRVGHDRRRLEFDLHRTITPEIVAKIIEKERTAHPDEKMVLLPTMGGQTALNCALSLNKMGVLEKFDVEMIGAKAHCDRHGGGPRALPRGDGADWPRHPEGPPSSTCMRCRNG